MINTKLILIYNTANGEKILYDIFPIEKMGGVATSNTTPTMAGQSVPRTHPRSAVVYHKIQTLSTPRLVMMLPVIHFTKYKKKRRNGWL